MTAIVQNTIFISLCNHPTPDKYSACYQNTATHFGIPLTWIEYNTEPYEGHYSKIVKTLAFLKEQPQSIEYAFFSDCRDTIFAGAPNNILTAFNENHTSGVLCQASKKPAWLTESGLRLIQKQHTHTVNAGGYCGKVVEIIELLERCERLHNAIQQEDESDPLVCAALNPEYCTMDKERILLEDEVLFHLIQTGIDVDCVNLLKSDSAKKVTAAFGNSIPSSDRYPPFSYSDRRKIHVDSFDSIGSARILHGFGLAHDTQYWECFIAEMMQYELTGKSTDVSTIETCQVHFKMF